MSPSLALIACLVAAGPDPIEAEHSKNALYREMLADGVSLGGVTVWPPAPRFVDGQSAAEQKAALVAWAGGDRAAADLLRDSVTAPFILKLRDEETPEGDILRQADLVFVLHADLDQFDPAQAARDADGKVTEVANMRVETRLLPKEGGPGADALQEWHAHLSARLLDRLVVEATDRVVVSRSPKSIVVASRTDPRFDGDAKAPNLWRPIDRDGKPTGPDHPYPGGLSYTKITRLADPPSALAVEAHFAFLEPKPWFDGAPILRSKFAPVAQDQIRRLRREIKARAR